MRRLQKRRTHVVVLTPTDLPWMLGFLAARALPSCEQVENGTYRRCLRIGERLGWIALHSAKQGILEVDHTSDLHESEVHTEVRRMLDLDAPPHPLQSRRWSDPRVAALVQQRPGIRLPVYTDPFEALVRAVLGQQVSVAAARTIGGRLVTRFGEKVTSPDGSELRAFPSPSALAACTEADLRALGLTGAKTATLNEAARAVTGGRIDLYSLRKAPPAAADAALQSLSGVGPWTAGYVRMRGFGDRNVLLVSDLGVAKALAQVAPEGSKNPLWLANLAQEARPFGSYLTLHLWASLGAMP